ncbi:hypothetical protein V1509DRAFT_613879 [Lipomyces kononenkoae]
MSKRRPTNQITRETYHDDDDDSIDSRHGPPDVTVEASPQVLAGRKILQPRSRKVNGIGTGVPSPVSGNPFASLTSASPLSANSKPPQSLSSAPTPPPTGSSSNPFAFLSQTPNTTQTPTATASAAAAPNADAAPAPSTGFSFGSQSPSISFNAAKNVSTSTTASQPSFNFSPTTPAPVLAPAATTQASAPSRASDKTFSSTEYVRFLKIRALNEKFRDSVIAGLEKDALGDLKPLCKAYMTFFDRIDNETKEAAKSQAEFAAMKDDEPAKAQDLDATTSYNSTAAFTFGKPATATTPSFSFRQPAAAKTPETKPKDNVSENNPSSTPSFQFSASAPAFSFNKVATDTNAAAATSEKKVDSPMTVPTIAEPKQEEAESDSESADSDSVAIQGPSFVTKPELLSSTGSPFKFNPTTDLGKSNLDGPSFTFSPSSPAKVSSPFKFAANPPAPENPTEPKPTTSAVPFSFGLSSSESSPSITPTNAVSSPAPAPAPAKGPEEAKKPAFSFGTSSFAATPFSFGTGSAFGKSTESEGAESKSTTPPPSDSNITTGSPLKISSLGSSNTSTGINPFTIKSTTESQSSPFKFNVPAPSAANTPSATPAKPASDSKSSTETVTPIPALLQTDKPATSGNTPLFSFGAPSSTPTSSSSPFANNTWTPDKGIKFAQQDDKATTPTENVAAKPSSSAPAFSFNNPLGTTSTVSPFAPSTIPSSNGSASGNTGFSFGGASAFKPAVGFSFGSSPSSSTAKPGLVASLAESSKEGTPAESSGGEGVGGEDGDAAPPEKQINLSNDKGPGEEEEDILLEGRTKVFQFKTAAERKAEAKDDQKTDATDGFVTIGLGPYRVLTHQKTKKTRILVRADGSGRVLLNIALRKNVDYSATDTSVRILDFIEGGKGVTYLLKVKTKADAEKLREVLQERKNA